MTGWSELSGELPERTNMVGAQEWLLEQWSRGNYPDLEFFPVTTHAGQLKATFMVANQIRIGEAGDSILPIVSAQTAQRVADASGMVLTTPLLEDAIAQQGELISYVDEVYADVADLSAGQMVRNSKRIDDVLASRNTPAGLWTVGKSWAVHAWYNDPKAAGLRGGYNTGINYAAHTHHAAQQHGPWRSVSLPDELRVWQPPGGRGELWHDLRHVDISQKAPHLVARTVYVQGPGIDEKVDIEDLARDPKLSPLVSSAGPIQNYRIPIEVLGGNAPAPSPGGGGGGRAPVPSTPVGNRPASSSARPLVVGAAAIGLGAAVLWYLSG